VADTDPAYQTIASEIAREIAAVHQEAYGTGVSNVVVDVSDLIVCIVMDIELAANEKTLIGAGRHESVKITREAFQDAIEPTFTAIVERATGRRVRSFASRTILDSEPWSAEVFRLHPAER